MNELSNLQLFVRVVEEGSFSGAARYLDIAPSSVSRQVSQLERELGTRLFHRTTRKQSLTESGEIYYQHASRIAADLDEARAAVNRLTGVPAGSLRVTVEADFAVAFIAPILPEFLDRYQEVQVRLFMTPEQIDLIDGNIDVAIRIGHLEDSSLIARKIATSRSTVCASPSYLAKHGTPTQPRDLEAHNCLSFRTSSGKIIWRFSLDQKSIDVPISGRMNANSLVFLRSAAMAARGIIMVPRWVVSDELASGKLATVLEKYTLIPSNTPINAVFAHNRHLAPKVRAFVDFLAEHMDPL